MSLSKDFSVHKFSSYSEMINALGADDQRIIAQIKRFFECIEGDRAFRNALSKNPGHHGVRKRIQTIGIEFDPTELSPFWLQPERAFQFYRGLLNLEDKLVFDADFESELKKYPLAKLWAEWQKARKQLINTNRSSLPLIHKNPRFNAWHQRRISSAKSELGYFGEQIDHPIFAFELSKGCSLSCWFCGFSTDKLNGVFDYTPENRALWREVVQVGVDMFGSAAGMALCYYGTEPYDNPHYLDFLKEYQKISGAVLCTSTAAPLHNTNWFRDLIGFYRKGQHPWPRISVLSVPMLYKIHETYTPEELRDVGLLMQMKNAPRMKAKSGRILDIKPEKLGDKKIPGDNPIIPQGSIACVSGFLVNMVDRTIKLVSPCYASKQWQLGYRVFAEESFRDGTDYRAAIEHIVDTHMFEHPTPETTIAFRDDLQYVATQNGFMLQSPNKKHHIKRPVFLKNVGTLIMKGGCTYGEIFDKLIENGVSYFDTSLSLMTLFDRGLLDETQIGK